VLAGAPAAAAQVAQALRLAGFDPAVAGLAPPPRSPEPTGPEARTGRTDPDGRADTDARAGTISPADTARPAVQGLATPQLR
jgi:hypothetical protein